MNTGRSCKHFFAGILLSLGLLQASAQDNHFSQFFETPLLRNPSLAGIFTGDYRIQGVYRDQWNSITNAYRTGSLNAEIKMPVGAGNDFITTGIQALVDKAGTVGLTTTHILPALNYHKSLSDEKTMYLSLGFMGGLIRKRIDITKVTTDNQFNGGFDGTLPTGENFLSPNYNTWDASVGMSFNTTFGVDQGNSFFIGAAYHHLNRPKSSFYRNRSIELNPKYVGSIGVKWSLDDLSSFTLQADHSIQGNYNETIGGALYSYKLGLDIDNNPTYTLSGGLFLRWKDALVPVVKLEWGKVAAALSYDINISPLKTASMGQGGFELSISYIGFLRRDNSSEYKMLCPKF